MKLYIGDVVGKCLLLASCEKKTTTSWRVETESPLLYMCNCWVVFCNVLMKKPPRRTAALLTPWWWRHGVCCSHALPAIAAWSPICGFVGKLTMNCQHQSRLFCGTTRAATLFRFPLCIFQTRETTQFLSGASSRSPFVLCAIHLCVAKSYPLPYQLFPV